MPFHDTTGTPSKGYIYRPSASPLGIYAKTDSAPSGSVGIQWAINHETGEATPLENRSGHLVISRDSRAARAHRYALKAAVNELLPKSRTSKCHRWRVPHHPLEIRKNLEHDKAFYSGLQVCSSVWHCPVCAAKISERRRHEIQDAMTKAEALGLSPNLLTLTVPHGLGDDINAMLDQMMKAWRKMTTSRAGIKAMNSIGRRGYIRALEVTHGKNGFHPHFHVLLFLENPPTPEEAQKILSLVWQTACERVGLPRPSVLHGCSVGDGSKASAYVAKGSWGLDAEMTKGHLKRSKSTEGRTPTDFLNDYLMGDKHAGRLFQVYAKAFHGRRQLYWSNGLRELLSIDELTDEEIATQHEDPASVLSEITATQWKAILLTRSEAAVLDVAEKNPLSLPAVLDGIVTLSNRYSNNSP